LPSLEVLSELLRVTAQREIMPRFNAREAASPSAPLGVERMVKGDGSVVTAADHAMQERLRAELARR